MVNVLFGPHKRQGCRNRTTIRHVEYQPSRYTLHKTAYRDCKKDHKVHWLVFMIVELVAQKKVRQSQSVATEDPVGP